MRLKWLAALGAAVCLFNSSASGNELAPLIGIFNIDNLPPLTLQGMTISPTPGSTAPAISTTQTPSGTITIPSTYLNRVNISSDAIDAGTNIIWGDAVTYSCCSSNAKGQRFAFASLMTINGTSDPTDTTPFYVSNAGFISTSVPAPHFGAGIYGANFNTSMTATATGWTQASSAEMDMTVVAGATVANKVAVPIVLGPNDAVHGTTTDAGISFYAGGSSSVGWNNLILLNQNPGLGKAIATAGCVICTTGTITMATGMDLSGTTISGNFLAGPNGFSVSGAGNATAKNVTTTGGQVMSSGAVGTTRALYLATAGLPRWGWLADNAAESGANAGSNISFCRFADAGTLIDCPIGLNRASAAMTLSGARMLNLATPSTPSTSSDACTAGTVSWDTGFLYQCVATNTWKRIAWATF